jgi:hypothetical protein
MDTDPQPPGIGGRVRWGNVARVVALAVVAAVVVAWPRLRAPAPEVPAGAAVPVREAPASTTLAEPAPQPVTTTRAAPVAVREPQAPASAPATRRRARTTKARRSAAPRPRRRARRVTTTRAMPPPAAAPPRAPWRPPRGEFDVE